MYFIRHPYTRASIALFKSLMLQEVLLEEKKNDARKGNHHAFFPGAKWEERTMVGIVMAEIVVAMVVELAAIFKANGYALLLV